MALRMITTLKVVFMTFDVLFDVVIFVVVINSFRRCDNSLFDVLIALINLFDVVMVCMVFGVLFGFRRSDFRSSDLFPANLDSFTHCLTKSANILSQIIVENNRLTYQKLLFKNIICIFLTSKLQIYLYEKNWTN